MQHWQHLMGNQYNLGEKQVFLNKYLFLFRNNKIFCYTGLWNRLNTRSQTPNNHVIHVAHHGVLLDPHCHETKYISVSLSYENRIYETGGEITGQFHKHVANFLSVPAPTSLLLSLICLMTYRSCLWKDGYKGILFNLDLWMALSVSVLEIDCSVIKAAFITGSSWKKWEKKTFSAQITE